MSHPVTVVGLGWGELDSLSARTLALLDAAPALVVRTARHPAAAQLMERCPHCLSLDPLYDDAEDFDALVRAGADRLAALAEQGPVVFAVPGQGLLEEQLVAELMQRGMVERILPGLTPLGAAAVHPELAPLGEGRWQAVPASLLPETEIDPRIPLAVTAMDDPLLAGEVKLALAPLYGDDAPVLRVSATELERFPLYELDRRPPLAPGEVLLMMTRDPSGRATFAELVALLRRLRAPGGCPWDREQTAPSLRASLLEEAYEAADAIDRGDWDALCEELGDVMMECVMLSLIAEEEDGFTPLEVTDTVCRKLILRHPHVFGEAQLADAAAVSAAWDANKLTEKQLAPGREDMEAVARALPALIRAQKVVKRAARAGLPLPPSPEAAVAAYTAAAAGDRTRAAGDALLSLCRSLREEGIDAEEALREATDRYISQF